MRKNGHSDVPAGKLDLLIKEFELHGEAVEINFRQLVPELPYNRERFTHQLHSYPAKVIPQIPYFFLKNNELSRSGEVVLDPFCGTGTVILESCLAGRNALGSDSNPLARLITKAKARRIEDQKLQKYFALTMKGIKRRYAQSPPDVVNLDYWFFPHVIRDLSRIRSFVDRIEEHDIRALWSVAFSTCVRKTSLTDPRVSVPVKLQPKRYPIGHPLRQKAESHLRRLRNIDVEKLFLSIVKESIRRVSSLNSATDFGSLENVFDDTCNRGPNSIENIATRSVRLIITSPPYLGAQKYIRSTSLSLGWLSLCQSTELRTLEDKNIGREHFPKKTYANRAYSGVQEADSILEEIHKRNPLRGHIAVQYLKEMTAAISQCHRVLKRGGHMVLVAGANTVCGEPFDTPRFLQDIAHAQGFITKLVLVDHIQSRGLMTKRNKTAGIIPAEKVMLFERR